jgi:DNA-binding SARP family transcriptional activator
VQFRVLGPLEVDAGEGPLPLGGPKQRAVLARLVLQANQVVPIGRLFSDVWDDRPPSQGRNALQTYVSNLRRIIGGDRLRRQAPGYLLPIAPSEVDASRFDALVGDARRSLSTFPEEAIATLEHGLSLWRGPALADLVDRPTFLADAARWDELRVEAQADRVEGLLLVGKIAEAIAAVEPIVADRPFHERLWSLLMIALYRDGRQAEAIFAYRRLGDLLETELGIDPSRELASLYRRLLLQDPELGPSGDRNVGRRILGSVARGPTAATSAPPGRPRRSRRR